jgi:opacity protein-like surface antigen
MRKGPVVRVATASDRSAMRAVLFLALAFLIATMRPLAAAPEEHAGDIDLPDAEASQRFYVAGIVGTSFATLTSGGVVDPGGGVVGGPFQNRGSVNDPLFTAGGAAGVAFDRSSGLLRVEFEARYRDPVTGHTQLMDNLSSETINWDVRCSDGWSTMANCWRDFYTTDRFGVYAGGGIGAGGYSLAASIPDEADTIEATSSVTQFAWQAGGGVTYRATRRMTLDIGYRFFSIGTGISPVLLGAGGGVPVAFGGYASAFSASELLLSVRIEEPFRRWR